MSDEINDLPTSPPGGEEDRDASTAEPPAPAGPAPGSSGEPDERHDDGFVPGAGRSAEIWDPVTATWVRPEQLTSPLPPPGAPRRAGGGVLAAAITGGIIGALLATAVTFAVLRNESPAVVERRLVPSTGGGAGASSGVVDIAAKARPWVVNINVAGRQPGFFGSRVVQGTGSGVILRSDGHIITNAHVVQGAQQVEVTLASGDSLPAKVVGTDPDTDVAVVKVDRPGLPAAVVGSARDLEVGELVVAIGSPLGLRQTVTAGIVSALGRTVDRPEGQPLVDMIQTDAAITQGNSGGALIDANTSLVGINSAIAASPEVGAEGIAFAIPIDIAKAVADELIATGKATHPWLGISGGNLDEEIAKRFGVSEGALVAEVVPEGPAGKAGLKPQDVIVSFDGEKITSMDELIVAIRQHKVGDAVKVEIVRGGQRSTVDVTLGDRPSNL